MAVCKRCKTETDWKPKINDIVPIHLEKEDGTESYKGLHMLVRPIPTEPLPFMAKLCPSCDSEPLYIREKWVAVNIEDPFLKDKETIVRVTRQFSIVEKKIHYLQQSEAIRKDMLGL